MPWLKIYFEEFWELVCGTPITLKLLSNKLFTGKNLPLLERVTILLVDDSYLTPRKNLAFLPVSCRLADERYPDLSS